MTDKIINTLKRKIKRIKASFSPKIIFVGGIPGSGKSLLIDKVQFDFSMDEFVIIDPDLYRWFFKHAKTVEETVDGSNKVELELLLYSLSLKKNIIHISSLRSFEIINRLIEEKVLPTGYEVYLYVIVTNNIESMISTYERYICDRDTNIKECFPRLSTLEYLLSANNGFDLAIEFFEKHNHFKNVCFFRRGKDMTLPSMFYSGINEFKKIVDSEKNNQLLLLNYENIDLRIKKIESKMLTEGEKVNFKKIRDYIIYDFLDKNYKEMRRYNNETDCK